MSIILTEIAAKEIKRIIDEEDMGIESPVLRVGVSGGGCSGFQYVLGFDDTIAESDIVSEYDGVKVVVDHRSERFLAGTTIDFKSGLTERGFTFNNPNAVKSCGCNKSFSPPEEPQEPEAGCGGCSGGCG